MASTRIALAGATGNLGTPILKALLDADFSVTVLSRRGGNASKLSHHPNLSVKEVEFHSVESLRPALLGVEVVVSCLATLAIDSQNPLIDASVAAGVKRFISAEFGMDSWNDLCAQLPVCAPKVAVQKYLMQKFELHPGFTFTAIANGFLLELAKDAQADIDGAMLGFCFCGSLCSDYGCDFSGRLDNELLGVKELGEDELRTLIVSFL
ncbi:oxidoreductase -like protein [Colletotrichum incanum]|uniref:Oxidoreductase-like protein n=1 Tax=Colletotrichum incanum TaxID=1573173 RepID=A0A161W866_COLIC|nr:oxidoreductase -like protein [Colletotrichum incanum]